MSDEFKREALTNAHIHAAVTAGVEALRHKFPDANIGNSLASEISATVVEAVRSSVLREAAHLVANHAAAMREVKHYSSYTSDHVVGVRLAQELLAAKADELDRHRTREFGLAVDLQRIADALRGDQS